jgi:hypothetical protein
MIGQIYKRSASFRAALAPLRAGAPGPGGSAASWIETRNLPTRDVDVAERIMGATGRLSDRTEKPVYRFRVFFDHADPADRPLMRTVADAVLSELDAGDLQVVIGGYDGPHPLLYVVVNRVHPIRGTAWETRKDYYRMMACLRRLEAAHGLRRVSMPQARKMRESRTREGYTQESETRPSGIERRGESL